MRGIISAGGYVPYHRLDRSEISRFLGSGGGSGSRAVASYDEDTTTLGVAAARIALGSRPGTARSRLTGPHGSRPDPGSPAAGEADPASPDAIWFATSTPAYLEKTNAGAIHAALRLAPAVAALDFGGAIRSGIGALRTALEGTGTTLVVSADTRDGLPGGADEASAGDAAAAVLVGDAGSAPILAEYLGSAVRTAELTERWKLPGARRSRAWEERFGEAAYRPLLAEAWAAALTGSGIAAGEIDHLVVTGLNRRAVRRGLAELGIAADRVLDDLDASVGNSATAHPALLLCAALERAGPNQTIALVVLADGVEVVLLRSTAAIADWSPRPSVAEQVAAGGPVGYGRFLSWRGLLDVEPPNRPAPNRPSAAVAYRRTGWKFGFVGSRDRSSKMVHLPPARVSEKGGAIDDMEPLAMADATGTVAAFTVDRLAYTPSPPVVFAVIDFDGGGRLPLELTDVDASDVAVGMRVEPTFRCLYTADEIHNYFWKARPVRYRTDPDIPRQTTSGSANSGTVGSNPADASEGVS